MDRIAEEQINELVRGNTETLLLFLVDELQVTYGYHIIKEIERRSKGLFQFKEGTVYPALRKLDNEGLLKGEWRKTCNGQERRYYRITNRGKKVLKNKMARWQNFASVMNLVLKSTQATSHGAYVT